MSNKTRRSRARDSRALPFTLSSGGLPTDVGHRQVRLEQILLHELHSLLRDEATDPELLDVQVASVHLSIDGGHARVAYAVLGALTDERVVAPRTQAALVRATGFLRARLAALLDLKRLPRLTFTFIGIDATSAISGNRGEP